MEVNQVRGGQKWVLADAGILGLSPSGTFAGNVRQYYSEEKSKSVDVLLTVKIDKDKDLTLD